MVFKKSSTCQMEQCVEVDVPAAPRFVKSSRCEWAHCVEVAAGSSILVRDSKLPAAAPMLAFSPAAWTAFTLSLGA